MFNWIKRIFGNKEVAETPSRPLELALENAVEREEKRLEDNAANLSKVRARDSKGRWLPDDPETEENEAYEDSQK